MQDFPEAKDLSVRQLEHAVTAALREVLGPSYAVSLTELRFDVREWSRGRIEFAQIHDERVER